MKICKSKLWTSSNIKFDCIIDWYELLNQNCIFILFTFGPSTNLQLRNLLIVNTLVIVNFLCFTNIKFDCIIDWNALFNHNCTFLFCSSIIYFEGSYESESWQSNQLFNHLEVNSLCLDAKPHPKNTDVWKWNSNSLSMN